MLLEPSLEYAPVEQHGVLLRSHHFMNWSFFLTPRRALAAPVRGALDVYAVATLRKMI